MSLENARTPRAEIRKGKHLNWHRVRRGRVRKSDTLLYHGFPQVLDHHTGLCVSTAERNGYRVIRRNPTT